MELLPAFVVPRGRVAVDPKQVRNREAGDPGSCCDASYIAMAINGLHVGTCSSRRPARRSRRAERCQFPNKEHLGRVQYVELLYLCKFFYSRRHEKSVRPRLPNSMKTDQNCFKNVLKNCNQVWSLLEIERHLAQTCLNLEMERHPAQACLNLNLEMERHPVQACLNLLLNWFTALLQQPLHGMHQRLCHPSDVSRLRARKELRKRR